MLVFFCNSSLENSCDWHMNYTYSQFKYSLAFNRVIYRTIDPDDEP